MSLLARQVVLVSQLHVKSAQVKIRPEGVHQEEEGQIEELRGGGLLVERRFFQVECFVGLQQAPLFSSRTIDLVDRKRNNDLKTINNLFQA